MNQAGWDRLLRVAVGLALLAVGWSNAVPGLWAAVCKIFGWLPLISGLIGFDPVYALLGVSTRRPRPRR